MFVTVYLLGAVSFLICRSYRDNAMAIGEIISWLGCTVDSKAYLWPLVPKFAGSNPAEAVGFFRAKKSSARLPSEGK